MFSELAIPGTPCQLGLLQIRYYIPKIPDYSSSSLLTSNGNLDGTHISFDHQDEVILRLQYIQR
jgi:hypothetical protein